MPVSDDLSEPLLGTPRASDTAGGDSNPMLRAFQWLIEQLGSLFGLRPGSSAVNPAPVELTGSQRALLADLAAAAAVKFDGADPSHASRLRELWARAYPSTPLPAPTGPHWKEMGWQGNDPGTDFRGSGLLALTHLLFFAERYPRSFVRLMLKQDGRRSEWEYPFAVAGTNLTFQLVQMLEVRCGGAAPPQSAAGRAFLPLLEGAEEPLSELYCAAFERLDREWLEARASYMEFNSVMETTKRAVEGALHRARDVPTLRKALGLEEQGS